MPNSEWFRKLLMDAVYATSDPKIDWRPIACQLIIDLAGAMHAPAPVNKKKGWWWR